LPREKVYIKYFNNLDMVEIKYGKIRLAIEPDADIGLLPSVSGLVRLLDYMLEKRIDRVPGFVLDYILWLLRDIENNVRGIIEPEWKITGFLSKFISDIASRRRKNNTIPLTLTKGLRDFLWQIIYLPCYYYSCKTGLENVEIVEEEVK